MGDTTGDRLGPGLCTSQGDALGSLGEIGCEPVQGGVMESDGGVKAVEKDGVVHGVESGCEVQEDEEGGRAGIGCHEDVISDPDQCCFGAVGGAETRLEFFG